MDKKSLVAYFSASGITEGLAKKLARTIGADIYQICPQVPYTPEDLDWTNPKSRSTIEMKNPASRPELAQKPEELEKYEMVYVGFPIWWHMAPTIINTFLECYDLTGKVIVPFATSGGSGMGRTNEMLLPSCKGAKLLPGKLLNGWETESSLKAWVEKLEY